MSLEQLVFYLKRNNVLSSQQYAFRNGHSSESPLLKVTEKWKSAMDTGYVIAAPFLDLKKAFDSVHHGKLLNALTQMGVLGKEHRWFHSYLAGRGVPQGTVLGSVFFTIYVNSMLTQQPTTEQSSLECFADDTAAYFIARTAAAAVNGLNNMLRTVRDWFEDHLLALNAKKRAGMLLCTTQRRKSCKSAGPILLGTEELNKVDQVRYLGVTIDRHLKWTAHINNVRRNAFAGIAAINRVKDGLPEAELVGLYHAFVEPHLTCSSPVWAATLRKNRERLEVVQRQAIRAMGIRRVNKYDGPV
ncbi:putative RNA-directed DNA polymerase from transposon BS [Hypsibius exemplaris]|uniref:RNA-directed DNA polymerase from transposon BS n=1 Tax=Hypsibius exemplaris TaxID=2072580 RepID=A0A9X6NEB4_HYPEX|nr:putative RNA-directed DNA polymerase from transposon BS [Hypsibius exemplaris]